MKYVYFFGAGKAEGDGAMKEVLGGKGAGLAEMTRIGLPVPAGFTITTECCDYYLKHGQKYPASLRAEVKKNLAHLERVTKKKLGDAKDPLLVSVRSGSARSMPRRGVKDDTQVPAEGWRDLVGEYKQHFKTQTSKDFPEDPEEQLWGAIGAVFGSWNAEKAVTYRRVERITGLLGTAVNVVQMVFGNIGDNSGTGVCFTRDPSTGEEVFYGDFLVNAQGEDVVAGIRTPMQLSEMARLMPKVYKQLEKVRSLLEKHYRDMQDMEFTVEEGTLYMLQTRVGKRTPTATFKMAVDMAKEGLITKEEALERIKSEDIERLFYPVIDPSVPKAELTKRKMATGINAVPGAAAGKAVFSAEEAEVMAARGERVILVRRETSPEDVGGMFVAQGIVTATGGKTSHAAVVARGWGKCCVVGCEQLDIDYATKTASSNGRKIHEGEWMTLD